MSKRKLSSPAAWMLVPAAAIAFAVSGPASKVAVGEMDPLLVVTFRCLVAVLGLSLLLGTRSLRTLRSLSSSARTWALVGGIFFGVHLAGFVASVKYTTLVSAMALLALEPIGIVLTGWLVFRDRPTRLQSVGIVIAVFGTLLIGHAGVSANGDAGEYPMRWLGDLLMLGAVLIYNGYYVINRRLKEVLERDGVSTSDVSVNFSLALVLYFSAAITSGIIWAFIGTKADPYALTGNSQTWLAIMILGLVPTLVGHTLIQVASRKLSPSWVAMVSPAESLGAIAIGVVLFASWPSSEEAGGGVAILAGALLVGIGEAKMSRGKAKAASTDTFKT